MVKIVLFFRPLENKRIAGLKKTDTVRTLDWPDTAAEALETLWFPVRSLYIRAASAHLLFSSIIFSYSDGTVAFLAEGLPPACSAIWAGLSLLCRFCNSVYNKGRRYSRRFENNDLIFRRSGYRLKKDSRYE
ncbi:hypothetical protein [uncultured Allobaculum sp.]|uniref:hypothetical protein n=1 Tax=uncultured Allobaculum sp. TaxID=1187017 RepID=UPI00258343B4|nr:hypothetical protein [uncultured Allobaculum sp.]